MRDITRRGFIAGSAIAAGTLSAHRLHART